MSAINYVFRVFVNQINPSQSKAFERFRDEMISVKEDHLEISATVKLDDNYLLSRRYSRSRKNIRNTEITYPKVNYNHFRNRFREMYLMDDEIGMPIYVHYGTNRVVLDIPDRIRKKHIFDKITALERSMDIQLDFRAFFEWYRDREAEEVLKIRESADYSDPALTCVRKVIETMIGNVKDLQIKRSPVRMVVNKEGKEIRVDMLSDGEKCTLALLGDLTRRLVLANPCADNPLEGKGIVLIDEIELHMHPSWQRRILHVLKEVFPNIQFIITTHSPLVLGEAGDDYDIISLKTDDDGFGYALTEINRMDGFDSNLILEEYMDTDSESTTKKALVKVINESIIRKDYPAAEVGLEKLRKLSGEDDEEYILAQGFLIRMKRNDLH